MVHAVQSSMEIDHVTRQRPCTPHLPVFVAAMLGEEKEVEENGRSLRQPEHTRVGIASPGNEDNAPVNAHR